MRLLTIIAAMTVAPSAFALEPTTVAGNFNWIPKPATLSAYPEVGPYRDHYVHEITFARDPQDGLWTMDLLVPEDLSAGRRTVIHLKDNPAAQDGGADVYTFETAPDAQGHVGKIICTPGDTWEDGGCDVKLYAIPVSQQELGDYTRNKYRGTDRAHAMGAVAERTGIEPIGTLGLTNAEFFVDGGLQGTGHWQTRWQQPDGLWIDTSMTIDFWRGTFDPGGPTAGLLGGFYYTDNVGEAGWSFGDDFGWARFEFNGDTFTGSYGHHGDDTPIGQWTGVRVP
jgi:hypothetical protein